jgi:hypothetical protein
MEQANSLEFLQAVYRNPDLALPVRMRAAIAALPHEVPRLAVTALVNEQSFAELLDRRLARIEQMTNGNGKTHTIDQSPTPIDPPMGPMPAEVKKPLHVTTNDRRWRRM